MAVVGDGGEGGDKYRRNGAGMGDCLQENCAIHVVIWEQELGGDGGHAKITRVILSSGR